MRKFFASVSNSRGKDLKRSKKAYSIPKERTSGQWLRVQLSFWRRIYRSQFIALGDILWIFPASFYCFVSYILWHKFMALANCLSSSYVSFCIEFFRISPSSSASLQLNIQYIVRTYNLHERRTVYCVANTTSFAGKLSFFLFALFYISDWAWRSTLSRSSFAPQAPHSSSPSGTRPSVLGPQGTGGAGTGRRGAVRRRR